MKPIFCLIFFGLASSIQAQSLLEPRVEEVEISSSLFFEEKEQIEKEETTDEEIEGETEVLSPNLGAALDGISLLESEILIDDELWVNNSKIIHEEFEAPESSDEIDNSEKESEDDSVVDFSLGL